MVRPRLPEAGYCWPMLITLACFLLVQRGEPLRAGEALVRLEFLDPAPQQPVAVPFLTLDEEGTIIWTEPGSQEHRQASITLEQRDAIITELVHVLRLPEIDSQRLWAEIVAEGERRGLPPQVEGAGTTRIVLRVSDPAASAFREVVVACPACHLLATRYPDVEPLQRLARGQALLENLRAVMQVGGFEHAERLARLANSHLAERGNRQFPLSPRDLRLVRSLPDGALFASFGRDAADAADEGIHVTIVLEPGRSPVVRVQE